MNEVIFQLLRDSILNCKRALQTTIAQANDADAPTDTILHLIMAGELAATALNALDLTRVKDIREHNADQS